jgi:hypothetical protein
MYISTQYTERLDSLTSKILSETPVSTEDQSTVAQSLHLYSKNATAQEQGHSIRVVTSLQNGHPRARGLILAWKIDFFCSSKRLDRLQGSPSLLSEGYQGRPSRG